ncbi:MAG: hypothetical protein IPO41_01895 [Acidobacteria bacterium]|nr:hypothetical protein [Acidobacteriota bacterium]
MSLVELIIIYLACGAPFAVFKATSRNANASTKWLVFVSALLGWPVFAAMLITRRVRTATDGHDPIIERLRTQMETAAFPDNEIQGVFDFRETFYRFVGLSNAVNEPEPDKPGTELFEIGGGGSSETAARCLARRNRIRLHRHYLKARREFMTSIAERADENLSSLASELAATSAIRSFAVNFQLSKSAEGQHSGFKPKDRKQPVPRRVN